MSDHQDYLKFLAERGYREEEVAPIMQLSQEEAGRHFAKNNPDFLAALLQIMLQAKEGNEDSKSVIRWLTDSFTKNTNHLIEWLFAQLCKSLQQCGVSTPEGLYAAVYPTESFNGATLKREEGALILIESGCFNIVEAAIDYFFGAWPEEDKPVLLAKVIDDYCISRKLPDSFQRMNPPVEYADNGIRNYAISQLVSRTEEFILAHELGHVVLGHNGYAAPKEDPDTNTTIIENCNLPDQEYEADRWAMEALIKLGRVHKDEHNYLALACSGSLIFLGILLLVEERRRTIGKEVTSHPPAIERLDQMKVYIASDLLEDSVSGDPSYAEMFSKLVEVIRDGTTRSYSHIGDGFLKLVALTYEYMFNKPLDFPFPLYSASAIEDGDQKNEKTCAVFSYNGLGMIGDEEGQVSILQFGKQPEIQRRLRSSSGSISSLAISDKFFAFGANNAEIVVARGKEVLVRGKMDSPVTALCATNSGDYLFAGSDNGFVHIYAMIPAGPLFSRGGPFYSIGNQPKRFLRENPLLVPIDGSKLHDCILSLAINNDDTLLAVGGFFDDKITIWDIEKSVILHTILIPRVRGVAGARVLSWCGDYLLSGSLDGFVRCWHSSTGELVFEVDAGSEVTSMVVSPDRKWIAVGTYASQIAIWPFASPDKIIKKQVGEEVCGLGFPIDTRTIVICSKSGRFEHVLLN